VEAAAKLVMAHIDESFRKINPWVACVFQKRPYTINGRGGVFDVFQLLTGWQTLTTLSADKSA
jgi:hypothetical protein